MVTKKIAIYQLLCLLIVFGGCKTTTTTDLPRRPQVRVDLAGNQIKEKLYFAGFVATGFDEKTPEWSDRNLRYGQHIINLPYKGSNASRQRLQKFSKEIFRDFTHPEFNVADLDQLAGHKPKAFVFAIDNERVGIEGTEANATLTVDISGQILVFDWKDRLILASYPLVFSAKDVYRHGVDLQKMMTDLYYVGWGANSMGFLEYFVEYLRSKVSLTWYEDGFSVNKVGIENIELEARALPFLQLSNTTPREYKQQFAQRFTDFLAKNQNLALVPYGNPDANGERKLSIVPGGSAMAGLFADNSANELVIPKPDFPIDLTLRGFLEQEVSKSAVDKVIAYGAFAKVRVSSSDRRAIYFEDQFKKILTRHMPLNYNVSADARWRWLDGALLNLTDEITRNMKNPNSKWCNEQSSGSSTRRALQALYNNQLSTCLSPLPNKR